MHDRHSGAKQWAELGRQPGPLLDALIERQLTAHDEIDAFIQGVGKLIGQNGTTSCALRHRRS